MIIQHANPVHQAAVNTAEMTRQVAASAAIAANGGSATVAAALKATDVAFFRSAIASCVANGLQAGAFREGLHNLTGQWT
jgi:hypothetical protein